MRPGLPEKATHDYVRHGTTTLFAALEVATGRAAAGSAAQCVPRSRQFRHHEIATQEGTYVRALLTSAGIKNSSIHDALVDLLDKPIAESNALLSPPPSTPSPAGPAWRGGRSAGKASSPLCELGWASLGVLELTALPTPTGPGNS